MRKPNSDVIEKVVLSLAERINTPRSLSVWLCFKHDQRALLELLATDTATCNTEEFQLNYFITEYLSKYKGLKKSGFDLHGEALRKWKLSEESCRQVNIRFREQSLRPFSGRVEAVLFSTQRKIASVLGSLRLPVVLADCKWGPGATFDLGRKEATPDKKISLTTSVTLAALPYWRAIVQSDPHWAACYLGSHPEGRYSLLPNTVQIVRGSRFLTVPKSAKTDRCIAAEPTGNSFLQQGVHSYMRRRLKRFGVDLDDQSINQQYARVAYSCGLSTLDLSAASDTISRELVYHLLPLDWAVFLDSLRSPETLVEGEWIRTEKFASMGNAFCFELETLIFWAICCSVVESLGSVGVVSVYGDDIIVPRESFEFVVECLNVCGFTVNAKKSFKDGYFFESCGNHFHRSVEVTPVYQKEVVNHPSEIIRAHNRLVRLADRLQINDGSNIVAGALKVLANAYPLRPFPRIPFGVAEDGGFLRPLSEFHSDPNRGFSCHVLDFKPRYTEAREDAMYSYKLRRTLASNPGSVHENGREQKGYVGNATQGTWRSHRRWIPFSALSPVKGVEVGPGYSVDGIFERIKLSFGMLRALRPPVGSDTHG
jgi:hypothetical protein